MTVIHSPLGGRRFFKTKKFNSPPQKISRNIKTYVEVRNWEYLFEEEVKAMTKAAFKNRLGRSGSYFRNLEKLS